MRSVDKVLKFAVLRLIARVHLAVVYGVIAVIVETRGVFHHRCHPYGGEAKGLDVVELLDQTFEVAAPFGVVHVLDAVPAVGVVRAVAVVEPRGHGEIDGLVAEVRAVAHESRRTCSGTGCNQHGQAERHCLKFFHKNVTVGLLVSKYGIKIPSQN